jgi:hypothetical protein
MKIIACQEMAKYDHDRAQYSLFALINHLRLNLLGVTGGEEECFMEMSLDG